VKERQRTAAVQDAGAFPIITKSRGASWTAPALWRFICRYSTANFSPQPSKGRIFVLFRLGIASGFIVIYGLHTADPMNSWTEFFLATTVATSVTGYFFPVKRLMPSHIVGIISLLVLATAIYARYQANLAGSWRWIYVVSAVLAQYLNFFVLIVQSFQKIPALKAMAPTQKEPPFAITQLFFLILFVLLGVVAVMKFHV
jgi:hypothetical protein